MKVIIFDGRIGAKGAEVSATRGGKPFVRFSVANNSYVNGQDKTEWFDVTSYDPFIIENKVNSLTKGTPVQIVGALNTEVKVKDGKVWVNQYVTADRIEFNFAGKRDDDNQASTTSEPTVSTVTGGTQSEAIVNNQPEPAPTPTVEEMPMASSGEDDLPF
jgi:single-stranded DNA-binding protein